VENTTKETRSILQEGRTIDEAIEQALHQLGKSREEVHIDVLKAPKRGIWGFMGTHPAIVRVTEKKVEQTKEEAIRSTLSYLFNLLDIEAQVDIRAQNGNFHIHIDPAQHAGLVIGKHGQTINAIEHLLWKMARVKLDHRGRVLVDVAGYRERQAEKVRHTVMQSIRRALSTGEKVVIEPLTPENTRMALSLISKSRDLNYTMIGQGLYRNIVLIPKKASTSEADAPQAL